MPEGSQVYNLLDCSLLVPMSTIYCCSFKLSNFVYINIITLAGMVL